MHLGIDLGTTNSAIVGMQEGRPRLFKTADGTDVLPSVIYLDKANRRFLGMRAYNRIPMSPENIAQGFKRLMGTSTRFRFQGAGVEWSPEECSAEILRTLVAQAKVEAGDFDVAGTVVTIPAAFNQMQCEATIRAASLAGLERVTLVQEPVAAAIASVSDSNSPDGVFLIYDIGGGTFDVALVQSVRGSVTILAHDGVGMLGGRDFDRLLVDSHVRPWLMENFNLPDSFHTDPHYARLPRVMRHAAEAARIELSSMQTATVFADDADLRLRDADGKEIYLSVEVTRDDVEELVEDRVTESVKLCRKLLQETGYAPDDISRVVLIGGPSKMPLIRDRVPRELGLEPQPGLDPMTAVATGAAIFAASREWTDAGSRAKPSRKSEKTSGSLELAYDYEASVATDTARLLVKSPASTPPGYVVEITDQDGVTYGRTPVSGGAKFELRLPKPGPNRFQAIVTDPSGNPVSSASREIVIERQAARPGGILMTYTLAVKVQGGEVGHEINKLKSLCEKMTPLPAEGATTVRAARALRSDEPGHIRVELFQQTEELSDPELALSVGDFRLDAQRHLDPGERISRGDELHLRWRVGDDNLVTLAVEVPVLGRVIEARDLYLPEAGHSDFGGKDGADLAVALLDEAERAITDAEETLESDCIEEIEALRQRISDQHDALSFSVEAETHRLAAEEARRVRQEVARLLNRPANRSKVLSHELTRIELAFDRLRPKSEAVESDRFDRLSATARRCLRQEDFDAVERALREMENIRFSVQFRDPEFLAEFAIHLANQRFAAVDRKQHDRLVVEMKKAVSRMDVAALHAVIRGFLDNSISTGAGRDGHHQLADLLGL